MAIVTMQLVAHALQPKGGAAAAHAVPRFHALLS
jgi:hypothetical protein